MLASVGTAAILAPVILMPQRSASWRESPAWQAPTLLGVALLLTGVLAGPYTAGGWIKSGAVLVVGLLLHITFLRKLATRSLPGGWEKLEHVVGMICVALVLLIVGVYLP